MCCPWCVCGCGTFIWNGLLLVQCDGLAHTLSACFRIGFCWLWERPKLWWQYSPNVQATMPWMVNKNGRMCVMSLILFGNNWQQKRTHNLERVWITRRPIHYFLGISLFLIAVKGSAPEFIAPLIGCARARKCQAAGIPTIPEAPHQQRTGKWCRMFQGPDTIW